MTFIQGQGQKSNIAILLETIKGAVTKFGTMVLCGKAWNILCMVNFTQGQGPVKAKVTKLVTHVSLLGFAVLVIILF